MRHFPYGTQAFPQSIFLAITDGYTEYQIDRPNTVTISRD